MNRKQLSLLIVLGAVLGLLGWLAAKKKAAPYQQSAQTGGAKLLPKFPVNDVAQITIKERQAELNLVKKDEAWVVRERGDYAANFPSISDFLRKFLDLKIVQPVRADAARLPQLELVAPDKGPGTSLEFKDKSGKVLATLLLGAKHVKGGRNDSPFGGPMPDGRYVMVNGDVKTVALVADALLNAEPRAEEWLQKDFIKVEGVRSVAVTAPEATNSWKLAREDAAGEWKLVDAKADEKLDAAKTGPLGSVLSSASFNDVLVNFKPEEAGLDKPRTATIQTLDGFTYALKLGKKDEENFNLQFTVTADLPKERTPGKDEKPEDKTRLDQEFADKTKRLTEKLKADKAFEKWTFVVARWSVESLVKDRKEWLADKPEKPEEPKKDDKPEVK